MVTVVATRDLLRLAAASRLGPSFRRHRPPRRLGGRSDRSPEACY